jgi:TRAP transporter TAXI family solute receptor
MVLDGRADAIWGAGIGYPGFFDLAKGPSGVRFIAPTAEEIARMTAKHPFLKPMTIPAGSYPGQTAPINSLGSWSFILTRIDLDDETAYRLARTLHGAEGAFCKRLAQACETTAANTVAAVPDIALIHPGVMKYFREIGVVK